jgi:hypothetical protein
MDDPQNGLQAIHTIWTGVITVAGGIVAFFTKRLIDTVDQKADKSEVDELKASIRDMLDRQDSQHASNTSRLDHILLTLSDGRNRRAGDRRA